MSYSHILYLRLRDHVKVTSTWDIKVENHWGLQALSVVTIRLQALW